VAQVALMIIGHGATIRQWSTVQVNGELRFGWPS